ncbi:hypothetical protein JZ751_001662 [Albula glossodonta]|uniref:Uncharacterized protein n=1 Tax=Albula glossodonta TaxID=121402 RepID=A0A8T2PUC2_9TELE|nr:hypothetical protein JZ751_001662 [Albula glossodonta]
MVSKDAAVGAKALRPASTTTQQPQSVRKLGEPPMLNKNEAKLDEILKEVKSLKDLISSQEKRIAKLEEQMSKIAI